MQMPRTTSILPQIVSTHSQIVIITSEA